MRKICSWGRRAAHSQLIMSLAVAAACASGIGIQGCSQGTSGRSLLSRLTRSEQAASATTESNVASEDRVVAGGLRQGTRRDAGVASVSPAESVRPESSVTREPAPSTSRDPWIRQPAPPIPNDGRPVASVNRPAASPVNTPATQSRSVDEWLNEIGDQRSAFPTESSGFARLSDIEPEIPATTVNPFGNQASLASSQQVGERPVWATESIAQANPSSRATHTQVSPPPYVAQSQPSPAASSISTDTTATARRTDALLQVHSLLGRAHELEAQGKTHDAYRFALVAHQIVQQEKLALPPGQERPIDYLDALSAASDSIIREATWDQQQRGPHSTPPASTSPADSLSIAQTPEVDHWVGSFASQPTTNESPFRQSSGFAEWRTAPSSQPAEPGTIAESPVYRAATFDGVAVPTIRPSSFGQRREAEPAPPQSAAPTNTVPNVYGPRFSDPATSSNFESSSNQSIQPASLSGDLTDPIDTASLSEPQRQFQQNVNPPAWQPMPAVESRPTASLETIDLAPELGQSTQTAFQQPFAAFSGPSFGTQLAVNDTSSTVAASAQDKAEVVESLGVEADAGSERRIAGKSMTFWAMIGGLVLLLACALLRRPTEPRESFH